MPSFGDATARILIVGLAPGAHGANRTGRMFTGDRSGDFLYAALHRASLANQPHATRIGDGLRLRGVYITAAVRCAPPANKPTTRQAANCLPYLVQEIDLLRPKVVLCLGSLAWSASIRALKELGETIPRPRPPFGHGASVTIGSMALLASYHVSQQNTFTGRLTPPMFDRTLAQAKKLAGVH